MSEPLVLIWKRSVPFAEDVIVTYIFPSGDMAKPLIPFIPVMLVPPTVNPDKLTLVSVKLTVDVDVATY